MISVVLADDHSLMREVIGQYLEQLGDVKLYEAGSLDEVVAQAEQVNTPDLVLLDLDMPGMSGLSGVERIKKMFNASKVVVVSAVEDSNIIRAALQLGISGYIPKSTRGTSLLSALKLILMGETYLPPALLEATGDRGVAAETLAHSVIPREDVFATLTERETTVLSHLLQGKTNKEIARDLVLEEVTVKVHLRNIFRKLGASNRTDAVRIAFEHGRL